MEGNHTAKNQHLFTVEILIEESNNGLATEKLLHILNQAQIKDYRIINGMTIGNQIEAALKANVSKAVAKTAAKQQSTPPKTNIVDTTNESIPTKQAMVQQFNSFKDKSSLVRFTLLKGKGIKLSIPCRVLNVDPDAETVSLYHVDEKKVYLVKLNEIEQYTAN